MSYINEALERLGATLVTKNEDYRVGEGEFSNFEFAGALTGSNPETVMLNQLGIKLGRLKGLASMGKDPNYESIADTIKDLAGYAVILYAYSLQGNDMGDEHEKTKDGQDEQGGKGHA